MMNSAHLVGCYPPRPSASVDNTLLDLQNSSYPIQTHSIIAKYKISPLYVNLSTKDRISQIGPFIHTVLFVWEYMKAHLVVCVPLVFQSENCPRAVQAHACYFHKLCPVEFAVSSPVKKQTNKNWKVKKGNAGRRAWVELLTPPPTLPPQPLQIHTSLNGQILSIHCCKWKLDVILFSFFCENGLGTGPLSLEKESGSSKRKKTYLFRGQGWGLQILQIRNMHSF